MIRRPPPVRLTDAERSDLHSKQIVLANRKVVLVQMLQEVAAERKRIRQLERLVANLRKRLT
jgi:hypothetical protein